MTPVNQRHKAGDDGFKAREGGRILEGEDHSLKFGLQGGKPVVNNETRC